jgi:hypothetical protein
LLIVLLLSPAIACVGSLPASPTAAVPSGTPPPDSTSGKKAMPPWYLTRGGPKSDQGWGVNVDSKGDVYFATYQQAEKELFADMVVYKFSPDGKELWHAVWGGPLMEKAFVVAVKEPRVYVGGLTYTSAFDLTAADMAVLALDSDNGSIVWDFTWGQGYGYEEVDGLVVDGGSIYLSGWTTGKATGNDVAILKLDTNGGLLWAKSWGQSGWDEGDGQMVVDGDSIYVAGRFNGSNLLLGGQGLIARFSKETGEYLSHTAWGGPIFTDALGMTSDGTYLYAVGLTLDKGNGGQIFLRKFDKDWKLIWEQIWGGKGSESARAVAVGPDGDIYVAGESDRAGNGGGLDIALLRYDPQGNLVWAQTWGGPQNEGALGIALSGDFVYIAGNTRSFGNGQDEAILIKANAITGEFAPAAIK